VLRKRKAAWDMCGAVVRVVVSVVSISSVWWYRACVSWSMAASGTGLCCWIGCGVWLKNASKLILMSAATGGYSEHGAGRYDYGRGRRVRRDAQDEEEHDDHGDDDGHGESDDGGGGHDAAHAAGGRRKGGRGSKKAAVHVGDEVELRILSDPATRSGPEPRQCAIDACDPTAGARSVP
jgi:hypothetical protein